MPALLEDNKVFVTPDQEIARTAERLEESLRSIQQRNDHAVLTAETSNIEPIRIPDEIFQLLVRLFAQLKRGEAIFLSPIQKQLTTHQAAKFLGVSRQYLCRLLDQGRIPFTRVGTHRRISLIDLIKYREDHKRARKESLDELTKLTEDSGLEYFSDDLRG
jgi:excisionase family DNA binding protein